MADSGSVHRRRAEPEDRDFFFSTRKAAFHVYVEEISGWDELEQRTTADNEFDELPLEIIEESGRAVGYLCVIHADDHDFVEEIALVPEAQGHGIGTRLMREVMRSAGRRRVPVRLSVLVNNPAQALYQRLGFHVVHVEHPRVRMEWRESSELS